ncbi:type I glyceraldehyde-3-phosphate dehydrogenase [Thermodesulfovibrio thiophilus]|uniref:type I glyceraldehyde-3-phosphate dehydrogenase n=1 Tax=Thermodesulfovibrio thiophilus TaxID=340095 RepID=UPI00180C6F72|nr:type I glyceraldehyde-3-phosphate dehydrogenase [Thermodesulfovibrio thiophilus]HHW20683.1 type I glyceraldehyde-3-phosphate dehydrogenase [Thermodesulfovibrio thiophilus]
MSIRIAINGFGRIGRLFYRSCYGYPDIEIVAINDLTEALTLAHLLKYDSVHGTFKSSVKVQGNNIVVDGKEIQVFTETSPERLPWADLKIDAVVESTGKFTDRAGASRHIQAGAKWVIITAPAKEEDITIVMGVNHHLLDPSIHKIISNASCTTNCLAPVVKILHENFGIERGFATTVHSYTNDQRILDLPHKDLRRARAAAVSMIPTTTGAAKAVGKVLPGLKGKLDGLAVRVPTPNVSMVDFVTQLSKVATEVDINEAFKKASNESLKGILHYVEEPLVSIDFNDSFYSSIVDSLLTKVIEGKLAKVISWYDNEYGYSCRVRDLVLYLMKKI